MRNTLVALLILGVIASAGTTGAITAANHSNTADITSIADSPYEWEGQEVTVEGCVGFIMDNQFVLWDDAVTSTITVKSTGPLPRGEMLDRVRVVGPVRVENLFGEELPYISAESWEYV
jgi:hypothetical protein